MYNYHGIAVYEIIDNGKMLSGICVNNDSNPAIIGSDIAIWKSGDIETKETYELCTMYEKNKNLVNCTLVVTKKNNIYEFIWDDYWKGIGLKAGNNRIAVSYSHII